MNARARRVLPACPFELSFNINFSSYATCSYNQQICDSLGTSFTEAHMRRYGSSLYSGRMSCWPRLETRGDCAPFICRFCRVATSFSGFQSAARQGAARQELCLRWQAASSSPPPRNRRHLKRSPSLVFKFLVHIINNPGPNPTPTVFNIQECELSSRCPGL